jgi:hypothetical protein
VLKINVKKEEHKQNISNTRRLKFATDPAFVEIYKKLGQLKSNDPKFIETMKQVAQNRKNDPNWVKNNKLSNQRKAKDPNWRENNRLSKQRLKEDPNWVETMKQAAQKRSKDPVWQENNRQAKRSRYFPVLTPIGVFESAKHAGRAYSEKNFKNGYNFVRNNLKLDPTNFYHITWEEYDKIMQNNG